MSMEAECTLSRIWRGFESWRLRDAGAGRLAYHAQRAYRCGVNEVEQLPVRLPFSTETDTFTLYPGVAPLM
jgi:hypothetical protein